MQIKPDEITSILKSRIEGLDDDEGGDLSEVGTVLSIADGISRVHGLDNCMSLEMLEFPHDVTGLALNLESDNVGAVLFGDWDKIAVRWGYNDFPEGADVKAALESII